MIFPKELSLNCNNLSQYAPKLYKEQTAISSTFHNEHNNILCCSY